jgi:hypothetical protein
MLQVEQPVMTTTALRFFIVTAIFMAFVVTGIYLVLRYFRAQRSVSESSKLREQFEKSKTQLLAAAMAKKQAADQAAGVEREVSAEDKERELLKENVDPELVIGKTCGICGLELSEDEELVIDPYSGAGYHLSDFLNDWPLDADGKPLPRPKFIYRYPQDTVLRSTDLLRGF